jgi:hypothetical protein
VCCAYIESVPPSISHKIRLSIVPHRCLEHAEVVPLKFFNISHIPCAFCTAHVLTYPFCSTALLIFAKEHKFFLPPPLRLGWIIRVLKWIGPSPAACKGMCIKELCLRNITLLPGHIMRFLNHTVCGKLDRFKNEQISLHDGAQSSGIRSTWVWPLAPHFTSDRKYVIPKRAAFVITGV